MKKILIMSAAACALVFAASCEKTELAPPFSAEFETVTGAVALNIEQGQTLTIPFTLDAGKGEVKTYLRNGNEDFEVNVKLDAPYTSGELTVKAPELILTNSNFEVNLSFEDEKGKMAGKVINIHPVALADKFDVYSEHSNCYIASPGSLVKFPAFKGNSDEAVNYASVEVLWQDVPNLVSLINTHSDGTIYAVFAKGLSGNAVISAKDASGKILWSWHIWVTSYNPESNLMTYTIDDVEYNMMDRNIGALANDCSVDAAGMFYEWGRNVPFSGKQLYDKNGEETAYEVVATTDELAKLEVANLLEHANSTPLTFYNGGPGNFAGKYAWFTNSTTQITENAEGKLWNAEGKSAVDPCPVGYKMPNYAAFGFTKTFASQLVYDGLNAEGTTPDYPNIMGWTYDNGGKKFYFPLQGDINPTGTVEYYYHPENTASGYRYLRLWITNYDKTYYRGYFMTMHSKTAFTFQGQYFNYGCAVRCVKE